MTERVLVTGISGFIAKHVALALLNAGYEVVGTIRSASAKDGVQKTLSESGDDSSRLLFRVADLRSPSGWKEAIAGCRWVQHIASPFPMKQPRDREALVPAARQGALRVIEAALAEGVERVVMTSSMAAMMYRPNRPQEIIVHEGDWTDTSWAALSAYIISKTRAERAAWDYVEKQDRKQSLTTINPGFVLGPALDSNIGTSLRVIEMILKGTIPAVPPTSYPIVDVRDLADLHVKAMTTPEAQGRRLIAADGTLSMLDMANLLRNSFPKAAERIPRRELPGFLVHTLALFDPAFRSLVADIGVRPTANARYVTEMCGTKFRPAEEAVIDAAASII